MIRFHWLRLLGLCALLLGTAVPASEIRDTAGFFSPEAVRRAQDTLNQVERQTRVPVLIETVTSLPAAMTAEETTRWSKDTPKKQVDALAERKDREWGNKGLYVLLSKREHVISHVLVPGKLASRLSRERRLAMRDAFLDGFRRGDFDAGLKAGVEKIRQELGDAHSAESRAALPGPSPLPGPRGDAAPDIQIQAPPPRGGGALGWLTLIVILLGIVIIFRILRGVFGAMTGGYNRPSMPPGGPGGPPHDGYGGGGHGGGYGPRGGGFLSGMFGGLGGAILGNWMYDRFNRPGGHYPTGGHAGGWGMPTSTDPSEPASFGGASDSIAGGQDDAGASWGGGDDAGGGWGDFGGGDWGGGDGGGDW